MFTESSIASCLDVAVPMATAGSLGMEQFMGLSFHPRLVMFLIINLTALAVLQ